MAKKSGRPPGAKNKVGHDEKEFLKGLLAETSEEYRAAFIDLAKSSVPGTAGFDKVKAARFLNLRADISKMIVPKPVEIDATITSTEFETLVALSQKWDDEPE